MSTNNNPLIKRDDESPMEHYLHDKEGYVIRSQFNWHNLLLLIPVAWIFTVAIVSWLFPMDSAPIFTDSIIKWIFTIIAIPALSLALIIIIPTEIYIPPEEDDDKTDTD